ncbi:MAG: shikimate dehydrogenase [Actinomycetota bacterium]|nr:shikimate dehydrogenase [Actinomycetota bacterium]
MTARPPSRARGHGAQTTLVGVMGDPIAHSLSPVLHNAAFDAMGIDWVSLAFRVRTADLAGALAGVRALGLAGLSVTMPHKAGVVPLLDELTPVARSLGAVNCIVRRGSVLVGDNTDGEGFLAALRRGADLDPEGLRCMVLGAGGAARAVILALAQSGASEVLVVNRTPQRAADAASLAGRAGRIGTPEDAPGMDIVVQATPAGMAGVETGARPLVDAAVLGPGRLAVDLVYHPLVTPWLDAAARHGAKTLGGLGMLVHQAAAQIERWTGSAPPVEELWTAVSADGGMQPADPPPIG